MANEKLIYSSAARRAVLKADPSLAYVIDDVKAVDAVEVVRCKDCQLCEFNTSSLTYKCTKGGMYTTVGENDFCSYGERREGE